MGKIQMDTGIFANWNFVSLIELLHGRFFVKMTDIWGVTSFALHHQSRDIRQSTSSWNMYWFGTFFEDGADVKNFLRLNLSIICKIVEAEFLEPNCNKSCYFEVKSKMESDFSTISRVNKNKFALNQL